MEKFVSNNQLAERKQNVEQPCRHLQTNIIARAAKCLLKYCYNYFNMENKASSKDCFVEYAKWLFHYLVLWNVCRITYPHQISVIPNYPHLNVSGFDWIGKVFIIIGNGKLVPTNNWYPFQSIEKLIGSIFLLIRFPTDIWMHSLTACHTVMSPRIHSGSHAMNKLHFSVANSARRVCSGISLLWHYKNLFDQTELTSTVHNYWHITLASLTIMRRTLRKS